MNGSAKCIVQVILNCERRLHNLIKKLFHSTMDDIDDNSTQTALFTMIGYTSRFLLYYLSDTKVYGVEKIRNAVLKRRPDRPLITVCNHHACLDDPILTSVVCPTEALWKSSLARWVWCADEICFKTPFRTAFFNRVKAIPAARGKGLHQEVIQRSVNLLHRGQWVHIYPEGKVVQESRFHVAPCRWGVGKVIAKTLHLDPLVVPYAHHGMEYVNPLFTWIPRPFQKVRVLIGDPIGFKDLKKGFTVTKSANPGWGDPFPPHEEWLYHTITERVESSLQDLEDDIKHNLY